MEILKTSKEVQKLYVKLEGQKNEIEQELYRLQGEYRILKKAEEDAEAPKKDKKK